MKAVYLFAAATVLTFPVWTLSAQESVCRSSVLVTAVDQKTNEPFDGLTAGDLEAKFKNREVSILSLGSPPANRRFVFVVDRSGSMTHAINPSGRPYDPNQLERLALTEVVSEIPRNDTVAFLAFAGPSSTHTEFVEQGSAGTKAREILAWEPNAQEQSRRTPLWNNIDAAFRMLSPHHPGDIIVVLTDGKDNMSKLNPSRIQQESLEAHAQVLAILVTNPYGSTPEERAEPTDLLALAEATGGAVAPLGTAWRSFQFRIGSPLPLSQLISQLEHQYQLEVEIPSVQKLEKWSLSVKSSQTKESLNLLYPHYLPPCAVGR